MLDVAAPGATFLLNSPYGRDEVWAHLPQETRQQIVTKELRFYMVDAYAVAKEAGLGSRINTVMQTCFFALANVLPQDAAIPAIKQAIVKSYGKRGEAVLTRNFAAVDGAVAALHEVEVPTEIGEGPSMRPPVPSKAPDFVQRVTAAMIAGKGDLLPVSALPVDGTFPTDTARWEKRSIAREIPVWDPSICIDCAKCALVCPHAAIRMKVFDPAVAEGAPEGFKHKEWKDRENPGRWMTIQVAPDDCTGCGICVDVCPARSKEEIKHKSIDMEPKEPHLDEERAWFDFFMDIPDPDPSSVRADTVKGSQQLPPRFEYSGACAGCGETPYLKVLTQLFGDRMVVANATGCSSIYGGNLPTTPWSVGPDGRGPAWSNSLFEDNAEFGLGIRLGKDAQAALGVELMDELSEELSDALVREITTGNTCTHARGDRAAADARGGTARAARATRFCDGDEPRCRCRRVGTHQCLDRGRRRLGLRHRLRWPRPRAGHRSRRQHPGARHRGLLQHGRTGLQGHALGARWPSSRRQASPAGRRTWACSPPPTGTSTSRQIAMGADMPQTVKVLAEAEAHPGPSLVIAYSHCIAHGIDMSKGMEHQKDAVRSGYWPLWRYVPEAVETGEHPFMLDSKAPTIPLKTFAQTEARFAMLTRIDPDRAEALLREAQDGVNDRRHLYEQMAGIDRNREQPEPAPEHPARKVSQP